MMDEDEDEDAGMDIDWNEFRNGDGNINMSDGLA
jgi:hypothetical protein